MSNILLSRDRGRHMEGHTGRHTPQLGLRIDMQQGGTWPHSASERDSAGRRSRKGKFQIALQPPSVEVSAIRVPPSTLLCRSRGGRQASVPSFQAQNPFLTRQPASLPVLCAKTMPCTKSPSGSCFGQTAPLGRLDRTQARSLACG